MKSLCFGLSKQACGNIIQRHILDFENVFKHSGVTVAHPRVPRSRVCRKNNVLVSFGSPNCVHASHYVDTKCAETN